jgi:hypothetical protein
VAVGRVFSSASVIIPPVQSPYVSQAERHVTDVICRARLQELTVTPLLACCLTLDQYKIKKKILLRFGDWLSSRLQEKMFILITLGLCKGDICSLKIQTDIVSET